MTKDEMVVFIKEWEAATGNRFGYQLKQREEVCRYSARIPKLMYMQIKGLGMWSINAHIVAALRDYLEGKRGEGVVVEKVVIDEGDDHHPVCSVCDGKNTTWSGEVEDEAMCLDCRRPFEA